MSAFINVNGVWVPLAGGNVGAIVTMQLLPVDPLPAEANTVLLPSFMVPPGLNGSAGTFTFIAAYARMDTTGSTQATQFTIQKSTSTGAFSGTAIFTQNTMTIATSAYESNVITTFTLATCVSGDKLAVRMGAIGTNAAKMMVYLVMEQTG